MNILKKDTSRQVRERTNRDNEEAEQTVEENLHMMREGGQTNIVKG